MKGFLYTLWTLALLAVLLCLGLFVQGIVRDHRIGQPDVAIDLSDSSSMDTHSFRLWRGGEYDLALSSVNHAPPFDVPFGGTLEVSLRNVDGRVLARLTVDSVSAPHTRPSNMSWTPLDSIRLERDLMGKMTLTARVLEADPRFAGVRTRVHLRLRQHDPGMGGLVSYVAPLPAILFFAIAMGCAVMILQRGHGAVPLGITTMLAVVVAVVALLSSR